MLYRMPLLTMPLCDVMKDAVKNAVGVMRDRRRLAGKITCSVSVMVMDMVFCYGAEPLPDDHEVSYIRQTHFTQCMKILVDVLHIM